VVVWVPVLVFVGGGLGALVRWGLGLALPGWTGVLVANIVGSFALAAIVASPLREHAPWMAFLSAGLLGGFTTYSTFNVNVIEALHRAAWGEAALQVGLTVVLCLGCGAAGLWIGGHIPR
jgi:fluoride exporter